MNYLKWIRKLLSYLSSNLLQSYKIDHDPGYVEIYDSYQQKTYRELNRIYQSEYIIYKEDYNIYFQLSIGWDTLPSNYIHPEKELDFDRSTSWMIVDKDYIDQDKYRVASRKKMSFVDYDRSIPLHFPLSKNIPELVRSILDILPILDNSIRELEDNDVYIFPRFIKQTFDHEFRATWDINIIPDTISISYHELSMAYQVYLPHIRLSVYTQ